MAVTQPPSRPDFTVRAVLWDMDGTLMDSQPFWDEAFVARTRAAGGTPTPRIVKSLTGASIETARRLIAATGAVADWREPAAEELFTAIADDVAARVAACPPLLPGAERITSALAQVGVAQAIVSASPRRIVESVARALGDVFAVTVTGDDGAGAKPDPLPYATAVECLGLGPADCVVVEDSATGAASARSNGIHVVQIGAAKAFPADPGLVVVPDLASVTPHLLLWEERWQPATGPSTAGSPRGAR
ncbi:haloacid dehalogenase superfamily, subfamily IA, variant 3 with third motif having DD or ED [Actinomyces denticolens]|uniref:Haloacid dehalogenase superfamily, subfamily IA, variant 3 with third motif having DD or ED n=1 Tax=Actinomyces denticolens TaxID=52767 RepID=A0ABY1I9D2_9ACTO|nr:MULTISPECIES: HAD family phosphatase [Actinomyces]GAV95365.1 HAD hydrolase, family IA [Actinomyces denticolens]SHI80541.1 haloacid dehalogenase superfamily, subfamily IA, variant 3 with third motif having DD or ED [Actinomyces denticolens]SUU14041.1 Phosphorylated carbohydrates phosphatase TM_1254 [Actinomyces denticolens]